MIAFLLGFLPDLARGIAVNFEIAGLALLCGLVVAGPLIGARLRGGLLGAVAAVFVAMLWAAPTFVVMFFLANVVPSRWNFFGLAIPFPRLAVVVASQAVFATAYIVDNGLESVRQLRRGARGTALLFLPNLARAFFVMVTSSSQAAAIGFVEAVTVTLRQADKLPSLSQRLMLFLGVVMVFVVLQRTAFAAIGRLRRHLFHRFDARAAQSS